MEIFKDVSLDRLIKIEGFDIGCLGFMGIGMLGIFIIIGIIVGATYLTSFLTSKLARPHDDD